MHDSVAIDELSVVKITYCTCCSSNRSTFLNVFATEILNPTQFFYNWLHDSWLLDEYPAVKMNQSQRTSPNVTMLTTTKLQQKQKCPQKRLVVDSAKLR